MTPRSKGPLAQDFCLDEYLMYNLVRAATTYNEEMAKALKAYNLDTIKWRILMLLEDKGPSSVGDLARRSVTKLPTLTRMLTRMERDGLIFRRALAEDRRIIKIHITDNAQQTLDIVRAIGQSVYEKAVEGMSEDQIGGLVGMLHLMRNNLNRSPYDPLPSHAREPLDMMTYET